MMAKAPVLDRDHRILHHLRRFSEGQPAAVIGAERQENRAVGGADADRLSRGRFLELLEARHPLHRDADRDAERDEDDDREAEAPAKGAAQPQARSEEHTSELQSLMRISYAVFCLKKKKK